MVPGPYAENQINDDVATEAGIIMWATLVGVLLLLYSSGGDGERLREPVNGVCRSSERAAALDYAPEAIRGAE